MTGLANNFASPVLEAATQSVARYLFGPFSLDLAKRALYRGEVRVRLGSRAMAILIALVERPRQLVTKQELVAVAWPTIFVEEGTLRVHIAAVRRALNDSPDAPAYIANVMGQGYRFIASVETVASSHQQHWSSAGADERSVQPLIGRSKEASALLKLLQTHRLVTVVGPRGVGKSALAAHVAPTAARLGGDQLLRIDVSSIGDAPGLREALGDIGTANHASAFARQIVLLDNCEGLVRAVTEIVEELLDGTTTISFLVSSTEPLRSASERVYRLAPLATPPRADLSLADAKSYPSVELLVDRIVAHRHGVALLDHEVRPLLSLAIRLEGYPLAIEMAAAEVGFLGLRAALERAESLDDVSAIDPRRSAIRKAVHRERGALSEIEREILQRLAVFNASFALDDAILVCATDGVSSSDVVTSVTNLVLKSQLARSPGRDGMRYRIPGHIRPFVREAFGASPARRSVSERHAEWAVARARDAIAALKRETRQQFLQDYSVYAEDFMEATGFLLQQKAGGRAATLLISALPTLLCCGMHAVARELVTRVRRECLDVEPGPALRLALIEAVIQEDLDGVPTDCQSVVAATATQRLVLDDDVADAETFLVDAALLLRQGRHTEGLVSARLSADHAYAAGDKALEATATRLLAELLHYAAEPAFAAVATKSLSMPAVLSPLFGTATSHPPSAICMLQARQCWLTGHPDQALQMAYEARENADDAGSWALCETLALGLAPILLWRGDAAAGDAVVAELDAVATGDNLPHWASWVTLYGCASEAQTAREGRRRPDSPVPEFKSFLQAETWVTVTGSLAGSSHSAARVSAWCAPEAMRIEALSLLAAGEREAAEDHLSLARQLARKGGLFAWELRTSLSLARLWRTSQAEDARDVLELALERHREGAGTSDIVAARALLKLLNSER